MAKSKRDTPFNKVVGKKKVRDQPVATVLTPEAAEIADKEPKSKKKLESKPYICKIYPDN